MPEINLLHNDQTDSGINSGLAATVLARLLLFLVIVAVIIYGVLFFFSWQGNKNLTDAKQQVQSLQTEALANKDRNEVVTRQEQLTELETLIDNHVYWSYLLPELARVTLKSAKYTEIQADSEGKLDLTINLPSYEDVEKYLEIFDLPEYNQQFSNVRIMGINTVQKDAGIETELRLELTFNPEFIKGRM